MELHRITALPVADEHGRLIGALNFTTCFAPGRVSRSACRLHPSRKTAAAIRLLVLDVDGVLTDGRLYFGPRGEALKVFHVRDGLGIQQVARAGIDVAVISGRKSKMVAVRCRELGVRHVLQGQRTSWPLSSACAHA